MVMPQQARSQVQNSDRGIIALEQIGGSIGGAP
jgi:hypothetical protein